MLCSNQCKTKETHNRDAEGGYILILLLIVLIILAVAGIATLAAYGIAVFVPVVIGWIIIVILASIVGSSESGKTGGVIIVIIGVLLTITYFGLGWWKYMLVGAHNTLIGLVSSRSDPNSGKAIVCNGEMYYRPSSGVVNCEEYVKYLADRKASEEPSLAIKQEVARRRAKGQYDDDDRIYQSYPSCDGYSNLSLLSEARESRRRGKYKSALSYFKKARKCDGRDQFRDWIEAYILECQRKVNAGEDHS